MSHQSYIYIAHPCSLSTLDPAGLHLSFVAFVATPPRLIWLQEVPLLLLFEDLTTT